MGDMTAQMDQMNCNALLVNVTFKSDFMKKFFYIYLIKKGFLRQKSDQKKEKRNAFLHTAS